VRILGIETSTHRAGVALADGERVVASSVLPEGAPHSSSLVPEIDRMLAECGIGIRQVEGIAVGIGPGSFTGIRLGLATAQGLSISLGIPLRGIGSFDALVAGCGLAAPRLCPIADAHSHGCYAAVYERAGGELTCAREPFVCRPEELRRVIAGDVMFIGPHLSRFSGVLASIFGPHASFDRSDRFPDAATAARLYESPRAILDDPPGSLVPLYLLPGVRVPPVTRR